MKIATITCHNVYNYGASLQAYALQRYLSQAGHDVPIIDYKPYYLNNRYNWRHIPAESRLYPYKDYVGTQCIYFLLKNRKIYKTIGRKRKFDDFRKKFLTLTDNTYTSAEELRATPPQADLYIAGSDQIWNPYLYDPYYFLEFVQDSRRKIAYAPSFGVMEIPHRCQQRLRKAIAPFRYVSVREKRGAEIVRELTGKQVMVAVDPTLLVSMAHWQTLAKPIDSEQKYLFCYFLSENARYLETAEKIAREKHLTIRMLPMVAADFKKPGTVKEPVGPREWLGLVENADYVLTDSFHCTLFSIRFHKQFNVLQRFKEGDKRGQNSRIHTLLQTANMQNRLVVPGEDATTEIISDGCFQTADARMAAQAADSRQWLEQALQSCEGAGNSAN